MIARILPVRAGLIAIVVGLALTSCDREEPIQSQGENGSITGTVRSLDTDRPMAGAVVTCAGRSMVIGSDGRYILYDIREGIHTLTAYYEGYDEYSVVIYVTPHTMCDIYLSKHAPLGRLSGHVYVGSSRQAVAGVNLTVARHSSVSGPLGEYAFDSIPYDEYYLRASKHHYVFYQTFLSIDRPEVVFDVHLASSNLSGYVTSVIDGPIIGAEIVINDFSEISDSAGYYSFAIVPQGIHEVAVSRSGYNSVRQEVTIASAPRHVDFQLTRTVIDTLPVLADATVSQAALDGCSYCPPWPGDSDNLGFENDLRLEYYRVADPLAPGGTWSARSRFWIQLPQPPAFVEPAAIEAASLVLTPAGEAEGSDMVTIRRALYDSAPWQENAITWASQPRTYEIPFAAAALNPQQDLIIDVKSIYQDPSDLVRALSFQTDESGLAPNPEHFTFWSREAEQTRYCPRVFIQYTR